MASRVKVVAPLSQAVNTPIQMSPTPRFEVLSGPPDDVANVANIPIPPEVAKVWTRTMDLIRSGAPHDVPPEERRVYDRFFLTVAKTHRHLMCCTAFDLYTVKRMCEREMAKRGAEAEPEKAWWKLYGYLATGISMIGVHQDPDLLED